MGKDDETDRTHFRQLRCWSLLFLSWSHVQFPLLERLTTSNLRRNRLGRIHLTPGEGGTMGTKKQRWYRSSGQRFTAAGRDDTFFVTKNQGFLGCLTCTLVAKRGAVSPSSSKLPATTPVLLFFHLPWCQNQGCSWHCREGEKQGDDTALASCTTAYRNQTFTPARRRSNTRLKFNKNSG